MRSLDEHLRDASRAWMDEATPTIVAHSNALASSLRVPRWLLWGGTALGIGVIAATVWLSVSSVERTTPTVVPMVQPRSVPAPAVSELETSKPASISRPRIARGSASAPSHAVAEPRTETPAQPTSPFTVSEPPSGFIAEYERIVAAAVRLEDTDPLRAVSEYRGVAALSRRRGHVAHAVTALERAASVSQRFGDATLTAQIALELASARGALPPSR
jgi:hypothetical protein